MPAELGDPWSRSTYNGFAGGQPPDEAETPPARRRIGPGALIGGGVGLAVLLGLGFGFIARPHLGTQAQPSAAPAARPPPALDAGVSDAGAAASAAPQVPIAVGAAPKPEPPHAAGPLQVLPPRMAAAAAARPPAPAPPPAAVAPNPAMPAGPFFSAPPSASDDDAAVQASSPPPRPQVQASFDCSTARPGAEQMVCSDPQLAAADREMARAYRRALRVADAPEDLRSDQQDWMAVREAAARRSPQALASLYGQRIHELAQIIAQAEAGPDDGPFDGPH